MKSIRGRALLSVICLILAAGCGTLPDPTTLLKKPSMQSKQQAMHQAVTQFLPQEAKLIVPSGPADISALQEKDLDGDGQQEIIAFYQKETFDYESYAMILKKKKGGWTLLTTIGGVGKKVNYADFRDLNGDGTPEFLFGLGDDESTQRELEVYTLKNGVTKNLMSRPYTELAVDDLDRDRKSEIILLIHDREKMKARAELYTFQSGRLRQTDTLAMEGGINGYLQVTTGRARQKQRGVFLDIGVGAHSSYTALLILEKGKLKNVFAPDRPEGTERITFRATGELSRDINGDGIVEVPLLQQPKGTDHLPLSEVPWITSWYQWDGGKKLNRLFQNYIDYRAGFSFRFPESWSDHVSIRRKESEGKGSVRFDFIGDNRRTTLLTIRYIPKTQWEERENDPQSQKGKGVLLKEKGGQVFLAEFPQEEPRLSSRVLQEYQKRRVTREEVKQRFSIVVSPTP
ncbi:FG-GAP repeat domain-containing protein [Paludifilum halophilum]|uniref:VCBS repeat-containing protein n=1 Tax=Paludifilum halophilum TaxID=1642702 RepID=A0A235B3G6_9BACL|nr:VCBS repeat-containing protein [Paludifilum halophilum]OYD06772.1 hypothetical protein CHM34_14550 [Paludifilum halophilum]